MKETESTIYFDITDIIRYAQKHERVSGIQRVQINVITEIINIAGPKKIRGVAKHDQAEIFESIDLGFLTHQREFRSSTFLTHAGRLNPTFWPNKFQVKKYLEPYKRRKVIRAIKKIEIYWKAIFLRDDLTAAGLLQEKHQDKNATPKNKKISRLKPEDIYVSLGTSWDDPNGLKIAHAHHRAGGTVIQMIHDLIPIVRSDLHITNLGPRFLKWLTETTQCVDLYLCVSKNTQKDLEEFLKQHRCKTPTAVTPLAHEFLGYQRGPQKTSDSVIEARLQDLVTRPFVLCVGSIEIRKNGLSLIRAWKKAYSDFQIENPVLVFAGRKGWMIEDFESEVATINFSTESIRIIENPTDTELAWMYGQCLFTVYPSLYEGWGLPVGEGVWFNAPCLASNSSSIPEVCGSLVDYFDPKDTDSLSMNLVRLVNDKNHIQQRRAQIKNATLRTWRDHAGDVLDAISNNDGNNINSGS